MPSHGSNLGSNLGSSSLGRLPASRPGQQQPWQVASQQAWAATCVGHMSMTSPMRMWVYYGSLPFPPPPLYTWQPPVGEVVEWVEGGERGVAGWGSWWEGAFWWGHWGCHHSCHVPPTLYNACVHEKHSLGHPNKALWLGSCAPVTQLWACVGCVGLWRANQNLYNRRNMRVSTRPFRPYYIVQRS